MRTRSLPAARDLAPIILLVAANLIPLAGVAWFDWSLGSILVLYWVENGAIGLLNIPRIAMAAGPPTPPRLGPFRVQTSGPGAAGSSRASTVTFFVFHYGLFWMVHGVFVFTLFAFPGSSTAITGPGQESQGLNWTNVALGAIGIAAYHVVAFVYWDLYRREYLTISPQAQMWAPYPRLLVLHLTIILGAFLVIETGQPIAALALLVLLKTGFDLGSYLLAHGWPTTEEAAP
jgi:hypothetical protein